jgi:galacturan 1,4-alpha-galacturonidase
LKYKFQDSSAFFAIGGTDVNIFGGGTIDGKGQVWYDLFVTEPTAKRPLLFVIDGLKGGTMSNLNMVNPPNWFNLIANSTNIVIDKMDLKVAAVGNPAKNTDGWDTYRSSNVVIQNSIIDNTDDCVSFKPNSTQVLVQNLRCNGSHGISVGSLGQYVGVVDIVEDILIYNTSMSNAGDGARIKVFPGAPDNVTLSSGGGSGYVKNVVYDKYDVQNVDWPIEVTGCYTVNDPVDCASRPPQFHISDVLFKDFTGVASKKNDPYVATVACPSEQACENIRTENFQVKSPTGKSEAKCSNVSPDLSWYKVICHTNRNGRLMRRSLV